MSEDWLVRTEGVSKKFCKRLRYIMIYGLQDLAREILIKNNNEKDYESAHLRKDEFWALKDISFELKRGESLGVIGPNGAGKTTLLKLLAGILRPDEGKIRVRGRVGTLIELGAGFHPMLSGRENIFVNGSMLGMTKEEMNRKFDSIVDFAGIGDFLDSPVKTYSSGMNVRLGFSIAIHTDPDLLLVDEVLAVGDTAFQRRCQQRIAELLQNGTTLVLVSHNMTIVQYLSSRVLLLLKGKSEIGSFSEVYPHYLEATLELPEQTKQAVLEAALTAPETMRQSGEIHIQEINLTDRNGDSSNQTFISSEEFNVEVHIDSSTHVEAPVYSVGFYREDGVLCFREHPNGMHAQVPPVVQGSSHFKIHFSSLSLRPGIYAVEIIINDAMGVIPLGRRRSAWFKVIDGDSVGTIRLHAPVYRQPCSWKWKD